MNEMFLLFVITIAAFLVVEVARFVSKKAEQKRLSEMKELADKGRVRGKGRL